MVLRCLLFTSDEGIAGTIRLVLAGLDVQGETCSEAVTAAERIANQAFQIVIIDWDKQPEAGLNVLAGKIAHRVFLGEVVDYLVETGDGEIRVRTKPEFDFRVGQPVHVGVSPQKCVALPS